MVIPTVREARASDRLKNLSKVVSVVTQLLAHWPSSYTIQSSVVFLELQKQSL